MLRIDAQSADRRFNAATAEAAARVLAQDLAHYREPSFGRSAIELFVTIVPFVCLWVLMWLRSNRIRTLFDAWPFLRRVFLVRLFMIQHDCGHGSLSSAIGS